MRLTAAGCITLVIVLVLFVVVSPYLVTLRLPPEISPPSPVLPVGDTMALQTFQSVTWGNWLFGSTIQRSHEDYPAPLANLFKWSVEPAARAERAGAATIDRRGKLKGQRAGVVVVKVSVLGKSTTRELTILPRVVEYGAEPQSMILRVGEKARLVFRARLAGGARSSDWSPRLWPGSSSENPYGASSYVQMQNVPYYAKHNDEWWFDVKGIAPGSTTMYVGIGTRELAIPVSVVADGAAADPHADSLSQALLTARGYNWATREFQYGHVHFLPGGHADSMDQAVMAMIDEARSRAISWSVTTDEEPIELFFADTRAQMQELVGTPRASAFRAGERTAIFLFNGEFTPFLTQELVQLYTNADWGPPRQGRWLSAGFGTLIGRLCREDLSGVFRGQLEAGKMRSWPELVREFDSIDEIDANLQAASMVDYLKRSGVSIRDLWHTEGWSMVENKTNMFVTQLEAAWRSNVGNAYNAVHLDREKLYREGCK